MRLLSAIGEVDGRFVLEAAETGAAGDGGTAKKGVLHFTPARGRTLAGIGIAACLLVAGTIVFTQPGLLNPGNPAQVDVVEQQGRDVAESAGELAVLSASPDEGAPVAGGTSGGAASWQAKAAADASSRATSSSAAAESLANPWQDCDALSDAQAVGGFSFDIDAAALPSEASSAQVSYRVVAGELIEADYRDVNGNSLLCLRKGIGSDDVSGDYNTYDLTQVMRLADNDVTLRGSDDAWQVATWTANGYAYAIGMSSPLTTAEMEALVEGME